MTGYEDYYAQDEEKLQTLKNIELDRQTLQDLRDLQDFVSKHPKLKVSIDLSAQQLLSIRRLIEGPDAP